MDNKLSFFIKKPLIILTCAFLFCSLNCCKDNPVEKESLQQPVEVVDQLTQPVRDEEVSQKKPMNIIEKLFPAKEYSHYNDLKEADEKEIGPVIPNLGYPKESESYCSIIKTFKSDRFKTYDFSGDGVEDLIFNGHIGGESKILLLWENKNGSFIFTAETWGDIVKIYKDENERCNFILKSDYCCDSEFETDKLFRPTVLNENLFYTITDKYSFFFDNTYPSEAYDIPLTTFTVEYDNAELRYSPEINDESYGYGANDTPIYGNILAKVAKGSHGKALGEYLDNKDNIWLYVSLELNASTTYNRFYDREKEHKTGWIKKDHLKFIE